MGVPLNNHVATVTFVGANDVATDPDSGASIKWTVYDQDGDMLDQETQTSGEWDRVGTGVFRFDYTPPLGVRGIQVVAETVIDGEPAAGWDAERIRVPGYMRPPLPAEAD